MLGDWQNRAFTPENAERIMDTFTQVQRAERALSSARMAEGNASATSTAMTAMTISSSVRVNAFLTCGDKPV